MALTVESKKSKDGESVILRYAYTYRSRKYFSTGIKIPPKDFKKGALQKPVRSSNENAAHLNRMAEQVYVRIMSIQSELLRDGKEPAAELVYERYSSSLTRSNSVGPTSTALLFQSFDRFLVAKSYDFNTRKLYQTLFAHLSSCFGNLDMRTFDANRWQEFRDYLQITKSLSPNTTCIRLSKLKCFIHLLQREGIEVPIKNFPMPKEEIKKVTLDMTQLDKIRSFDPKNQSMQHVKDLCLFQCFTGLRISDLKRVNAEHIVNEGNLHRIRMFALKTNRSMFIPLTREALDILVKYNFNLPKLAEPYYNRLLKRLGVDAGLTGEIEWMAYDLAGRKLPKREPLYNLFTSHVCCRTAIAYFERQGYGLTEIASIVGKSMQTLLKHYYGRTTEANIVELQRRAEAKQLNECVVMMR